MKEMIQTLINNGVVDESNTVCSKQNVQVVLDKDGYVSNKKYQVIFVDEYNNFYLIGFYDNLRDAEPEINEYLDGYEDEDERCELKFGDGCSLGPLEEYAGTFSPVFDRSFSTTSGYISVRGFIFA